MTLTERRAEFVYEGARIAAIAAQAPAMTIPASERQVWRERALGEHFARSNRYDADNVIIRLLDALEASEEKYEAMCRYREGVEGLPTGTLGAERNKRDQWVLEAADSLPQDDKEGVYAARIITLTDRLEASEAREERLREALGLPEHWLRVRSLQGVPR